MLFKSNFNVSIFTVICWLLKSKRCLQIKYKITELGLLLKQKSNLKKRLFFILGKVSKLEIYKRGIFKWHRNICLFVKKKKKVQKCWLIGMLTNWEEVHFKPTFRNKIGTFKCVDMVVSYLWILIYNSLYLS